MSTQLPSHTRDVVVIGCSAGGVEGLPRLVRQLPGDLPASVFVVQHMAASATPYLVDILRRATGIAVSWAEQGAPFERAHVYVCPPDVHLLFADHHIQLSRAARENRVRPSIDKTFRAAAAHYGARVIGALLTGMLDDGVAGLLAIRDAGGAVLVQDPADADYPELPTRALQAVRPDRTLPIDAMGRAIAELVRERVRTVPVPERIVLEAAIDSGTPQPSDDLATLGAQSTIACPECNGPTWVIGEPGARRYRCYLGHVTSARTLLDQRDADVEAALWSAVRALHDRVTTLDMLAADAQRLGTAQSAQQFLERARETRKQAELARQFMLDLARPR